MHGRFRFRRPALTLPTLLAGVLLGACGPALLEEPSAESADTDELRGGIRACRSAGQTDCCGNDRCEGRETADTCASDCQPPAAGGLNEPCLPDSSCDADLLCDAGTCVEVIIDPCVGITCADHGTCVVQTETAVCQCDEGYTAAGLLCISTTPTDPEPCPAPALVSVEATAAGFVLTWTLPASACGAPVGGYDLVIDGVDTASARRTQATTTTVADLTPGTHCFIVEARWTQIVPAVFPRSDERCATSATEPPPPPPPPPPATTGYLGLLAEAVGFARPTGGAAGPRVFVTSLADSGTGTLRAALALAGPKWISFEAGLTGTIAAASWLTLRSDTTIDGRGANVTITGNGLMVSGTSTRNVIISHLKLDATVNDAIRVYGGAGPVWIHHCTFSAYGDGAIDVTNGSEVNPTEVTISYCHFDGGGKASLVSATSDPASSAADWQLYLTYHHNYFDGSAERSPRARFAKIHHFNNYLREAGYIGASTLAEIIVERDIFETATGRRATYVNCIGGDCDYNAAWGLAPGEGGALKGSGNWLNAGTTAASFPTAKVANVFQEFAGGVPPYTYTAETADAALRSKIVATAGWRAVPSPGL